MAALTAAFFDQLESYGYTGEQGIYASLNWTRARLTDPAFDAWRDNFWIARFNSTLGYTGPYTLWQASYTEPGAPYGVQSETVDVDFRMEELLITGFTDAKVSGAEPSFTKRYLGKHPLAAQRQGQSHAPIRISIRTRAASASSLPPAMKASPPSAKKASSPPRAKAAAP